MVLCWHRGCGKDLFALNCLIHSALKTPGVYLHCFPNYSQAKKAIWKSIHVNADGSSMAYLDHFPDFAVKRKNSSEMIIELKNGSIYCLMGVDGRNAQRARGMNPSFVIMSEYAYMDPEAWRTIEPRIVQNNGKALFISTPNGQNHFYQLLNHAKANPDRFYSSLLTIEDTKTVSPQYIDDMRAEGSTPEDFIQQEYYCNFSRGAEGSYYGKQIQKARDDERICELPIIEDLPVHTAWDIGIKDPTSIWWFQARPEGTFHFIDYYENNGEGLRHYIDKLEEFKKKHDIIYGQHFVPHDMGNREFTSGVERIETAREFGYEMVKIPAANIGEGIQAVRSILNNCYFDIKKCKRGIQCLDFYRKKYNDALKQYYDQPLHDQYSNGCFIGETKIETKKGSVNISEIKIGDEVSTPNGFKKVKYVFEYESDDLVDVVTEKTTLTCTPNHKFFTQKNLVYADALRYNDILLSIHEKELCRMKYGSCSREKDLGLRENFLSDMIKDSLSSTDISSEKMVLTTEGTKDLYTDMFGCITTVPSQKITMFIILMETLKTIQKKISKLFHLPITANFTTLKKKELLQEKQYYLPCKKLSNGTHRKREKNGIESMEKNVLRKEKNLTVVAQIAINILKVFGLMQNFAISIANNDIVQKLKKITKTVYVWFAEKILQRINGKSPSRVVKIVPHTDKSIRKVYDLEVDHDHCYYANEILVSNSDAFRYAAVGIKAIGLGGGSIDQDVKAINTYWGNV